MGSDKAHDHLADSNELHRRVVHLPAFEVARFPITVAEYAYFVRAGHSIPPEWEDQLALLDHPVSGVSWYDAQSYTGWLSSQAGEHWRLPTEAEWEKAARCDLTTALFPSSERIYPWGDSFDFERCTTGSSMWHGTSPIGWYGTNDPDESHGYAERNSGASPCGAEDMAGNVWEWTASDYDEDYGKADLISATDTITSKVLHGGSWNSLPSDARSARRIENRPDTTLALYGFRIVHIPGLTPIKTG
jgi:formylglycine-generating enzyme required for sulfatase activity